MENNRPKFFLRWITLLIIIIHILYNNLFEIIFPGAETILDVTNKYRSLFVPAGYTFSIWSVIYVLMIFYGVYQLLPSQKSKPMYDRLALPLAISMFMGTIWWAAFRASQITLSMVIIILSFVFAFICLSQAHKAMKTGSYKKWIVVTFSMYAGWLTAASFASLSVWLVSLGWKGGIFGEENWVIVLLIIAVLIGLIVSYNFYDYVYSLVIAWASIGIAVQQKDNVQNIAISALTCAIFMIGWSIFIYIKGKTRKMNTGII